MKTLYLRDNESYESLMKRFKIQQKRERFWLEVKKHKFYKKPSELKIEAKERGIKRFKLLDKMGKIKGHWNKKDK